MQQHDELTEHSLLSVSVIPVPFFFSFSLFFSEIVIRLTEASQPGEFVVFAANSSTFNVLRLELVYISAYWKSSRDVGCSFTGRYWSLARVPCRCLQEKNKGDCRIVLEDTETADLVKVKE